MLKSPAIPAIFAVLAGMFAGIALVEHLGGYRWFLRYDDDVFSAAILIALLEYIFVVPWLRHWFEEYQAKRDHEDPEIP